MSTNYYNNYSPWIRFEDTQWNDLKFSPYLKHFSQNEMIYHQQQFSDFVYLIKEGRVRMLIYGIDGSEQCLTIEEKGSVFGEISAIDGLPNYANALALVDSEIYTVPKDYFLEQMLTDKQVAEKVFKTLCKKVRVLSASISNLTLKSSHSRVATYLLKLSHSHGCFSKNKCKLEMKFTHQEMANLTGLSRVTVSNIMSELVNKGIISKEGGYLVINDVGLLLELSQNV